MRKLSNLLLMLTLSLGFIGTALAGPRTGKIIDGTPANATDFPYVARLDTGGDLLCTGTLVAPRFILTAAHCFFDEKNKRGVGDTEVLARINGQEINSAKVTIHPSYRSRSSACVEGEIDAAVVELASDVTGVTPISLVSSVVPNGSTVILAGYGTLGNGSSGENGEIPSVGTIYYGTTVVEGLGDNPPEQDSNSSYFYWTFDSGESNTASGDSGGPAFLDSNGQRFIAGITCGGDGQAQIGTLSFNTRGDIIKSWVDSISGATPTETPPGFATLSSKAGEVGKAFSFAVPVTGSAPLTLSATGLPAGLELIGTTISGTPSAIGTSVVTLNASNAFGTASTQLTIVISGFQPTLSMRSALLQFDYERGSQDFLDIVGKISVGKNFKPAGKKVTVTIGRFSKTFKLAANGQSTGSGRSYFDLSGTQKNGAFKASTLRFDLTFEKVKLFDELSTLGFPSSANASEGQQLPLPVTVTIKGVEASATVTLGFKSKSARWSIVK